MAESKKIIVSLTTISTRLHTLDRVMAGLMNQTRKAERVILNISLDPFMMDMGIRFEHLPEQTRRYALAGVIEIYFCRNTGPYRKIIPTLQRYGVGDYYIVTADDDVLYPPEWLEVLYATAVSNNCIASYRCRQILFSGTGFTPYRDWPLLKAQGSVPAQDRLPTGRDGVMYHASYFQDRETLRQLVQLAPLQDDVALRFTTLSTGIPVAIAERQSTSAPGGHEFPDASPTNAALWVMNYGGKNDEAIAACYGWIRKHRPETGDRLFGERLRRGNL